MTSFFKVGDVAILQNCTVHQELNGSEVTIVDGITSREAFNSSTGKYEEIFSYGTDLRTPSGCYIAAQPHQLRRKDRPQTDEEWAALKVMNVIADAIIAA